MDLFFSKSNLASLKDSNGSISTAECETCLPTHSHTSTRSSHTLACPSAPIPFETCDSDACSMNHSSVVSALAACCNLPHLTSPIRCTQSLRTACCADAPSQPSCDPCTIHPSCTDVACLDASCNTHFDAPQRSTEHAPDASAPHPHCVPQCDGQSHGQPHRLMDCHEPHVVIPAGQKNYDDLQQLVSSGVLECVLLQSHSGLNTLPSLPSLIVATAVMGLLTPAARKGSMQRVDKSLPPRRIPVSHRPLIAQTVLTALKALRMVHLRPPT